MHNILFSEGWVDTDSHIDMVAANCKQSDLQTFKTLAIRLQFSKLITFNLQMSHNCHLKNAALHSITFLTNMAQFRESNESTTHNMGQHALATLCPGCGVSQFHNRRCCLRAHLHQRGAGPPVGAGAFSAQVECLHWRGSACSFTNFWRPHFAALGHWSIDTGFR